MGYKIKDIVNPVKWREVIKMLILRTGLFSEEATGLYRNPSVIIQLATRITSPDCAKCVTDGKCKDCKCLIPGKMIELNEECSLLHWVEIDPEMNLEKALSNLSSNYKSCVCKNTAEYIGLTETSSNYLEFEKDDFEDISTNL